MIKLRWILIRLLWKIPFIRRRWCWADAVFWSYDYIHHKEIERANHECYYCMGCNTQDEIDRWQKNHE